MGNGPTVQRARLCRELRQLRIAAGLDQAEAAAAIGGDQTRISKIERGRRTVTRTELAKLLARYGVEDPAIRDRLTRLARGGAHRGSWLEQYTAVMSRSYREYVRFEMDADSIDTWEPVVIPGLLQTEEYARALIRGIVREITDDQLEMRVEAKIRRQEELSKRYPRPRLWAIIDESVLMRDVGGAEVTAGQMRRLLAGEPHITVQVLPLVVGAHPGLGSLTILGYEDADEPPKIYTETIAGDLYLQGDEARQSTLSFDHLRASALDADASADKIRRVLSALERDA